MFLWRRIASTRRSSRDAATSQSIHCFFSRQRPYQTRTITKTTTIATRTRNVPKIGAPLAPELLEDEESPLGESELPPDVDEKDGPPDDDVVEPNGDPPDDEDEDEDD